MISDGANSAVSVIENIIFRAIDSSASDIYIRPHNTKVSVKLLIDGLLQPATQPISKELYPAMLARLKVLGEMDIDATGPQQGRFRVKYKRRAIDFGVSVGLARHGQDALLYVLDNEPTDLGSKKE